MLRKEKKSWVSLVETNVKSENTFNKQKALCVMHYARHSVVFIKNLITLKESFIALHE